MFRKCRTFCFLILFSPSLVLFVILVANTSKKVDNINEVRSKPNTTSLSEILNCDDKTLEKSVEYRGDFIVFKNYIRAEKQFKCHESITLTAPGDYRFLDNIPLLAERWQGPISVALYSPGYDFFSTLQSIAYLRNCKSSLVKKLVTFHLFFNHNQMPIQHDQPLINIYEDEFDCYQKPPFETMRDEDMYKQRQKLTYPINVARNIAKMTAQTYFVFPSDIELYPTKDFPRKFLQFIERHPKYVRENSRNIYVLPIFEVLNNHTIPNNKTELQRMLYHKTAFLFHKSLCPSCHRIPNDTLWINTKETAELDVLLVGKRQERQKIWEPFFICTQKEPLWDERLNWEGQGNKMCQGKRRILCWFPFNTRLSLQLLMANDTTPQFHLKLLITMRVKAYYLCMLDYDFLILNNAFLIHKPGVKKKKVQNLLFKSEQHKNNEILKRIAIEMTKIYGDNPKCKIHNAWKSNKPQKENTQKKTEALLAKQNNIDPQSAYKKKSAQKKL